MKNNTQRLENWAESDQVKDLRQAFDLLMTAWGIISNASQGDWKRETSEWVTAASRWRDEWSDFNTRYCKNYKEDEYNDVSCVRKSIEKSEQLPEGDVDIIQEYKKWCGNCQKWFDVLFGNDTSVDPNKTIDEVKALFPCERVKS